MHSLQPGRLLGVTSHNSRLLNPYRVLMPIEFGPESCQSLRAAMALLSPQATIHGLHVLAAPRSEADFVRQALAPDPREVHAVPLLEQQLHESGIEHVEVIARTGAADVVVAQVAHELGCDLIVVPSEPRPLFKRLLSGSLIKRLLRRAPCPVLVLAPNTSTSS